MSNSNGKLCVCCLAMVIGVVWGLAMLLLGIVTVYTETYGHKMVEVMGSIYYGYEPGSWGSAFIGLAWGFADAFVATLLVLGLYKLLVRCCTCKCRAPESETEEC